MAKKDWLDSLVSRVFNEKAPAMPVFSQEIDAHNDESAHIIELDFTQLEQLNAAGQQFIDVPEKRKTELKH